MTFSGKQPPSLATTQSKYGEFCSKVASIIVMQFSVSTDFNFPKQEAANPSRQRMAFDPSH